MTEAQWPVGVALVVERSSGLLNNSRGRALRHRL